MKTINIVIDDENRYFAAGLEQSIGEYALTHHKTVNFLRPDAEIQADMVIVSSRRGAQRWRRTGVTRAMTPVVTIKERTITPLREAPQVLYRTDSQHRLFELLTETLDGTGAARLRERHALTLRERQVMSYLRRGLDQSQTARVLGVSVKTVHSHKRSVMSKMMLRRSHDFMYWLIYHEGEYS
ncbi:LuxR C-terminal-related transcriptional regulator [Serratia ureilytica]|nr:MULTISPECIES: LuxR family transcriptional regulator [Serratia]MBH2653665.1 helix-turn-helix transcriptional regulator [Serratia ureilytica]MBH2928070.1 helix-turn-helix transcriptional regulator [Serratia ureilytica]MDP8633460.1 LuxR C-terminal-related transcriptional regulator [Serratia marcescens]MDP8866960.1 LuxR C-terminal-related transcriptional regulator [Serratia marcescens]